MIIQKHVTGRSPVERTRRAKARTGDSVGQISCDAKRRTHHQIDRIWSGVFASWAGSEG